MDAEVAREEDDRDVHGAWRLAPDLGGDAVHPDEARHDVEDALAGAVGNVRLERGPWLIRLRPLREARNASSALAYDAASRTAASAASLRSPPRSSAIRPAT